MSSNKENDNIILIFSDVHLGNFTSKIHLFKSFLSKILEEKQWSTLEYIFILGDFLDLLFDTLPAIKNKHDDILSLISRIYKELDLKIIYVLGNHEIPVNKNPFNDEYFNSFEESKRVLLKKFEKNDFNYDFFQEKLTCQYIILKNTHNNNLKLFLHDSLYSKPIDIFSIDNISIDNKISCLLTHGHQFDGIETRYIVSIFWRILLESPDQAYKDLADYMWNWVIRRGRKISNLTFDEVKSKVKGIDLNTFKTMKFSMRIIEKFERKRLRKKYYIKQITEYMEDLKDPEEFNTIIYGHSHEKHDIVKNINNKKVRLINSGAWQHVLKPSFITIDKSGTITLREF